MAENDCEGLRASGRGTHPGSVPIDRHGASQGCVWRAGAWHPAYPPAQWGDDAGTWLLWSPAPKLPGGSLRHRTQKEIDSIRRYAETEGDS